MGKRGSIIPEPLTPDDFTDFRLVDMEYDKVNREKRYTFECKVRAEPDVLTYNLSMHDDGEHFSLHTQNDDIWFHMDMRQLRMLEQTVNREATFGLLEKDISGAENEDDLYFVNYVIWELERDDLTDDQWEQIGQMMDAKEKELTNPVIQEKQEGNMNINDIILVTDYQPGGEQVNYLMTMEDVLQKYLYTSFFSTQEFASTIIWLKDTAGPYADRDDWCTINISPEHTVFAKYCTDQEQMQKFLLDAGKLGSLDNQNSNRACMDFLVTVGLTATGAPFPLSGYSYQKIASDFQPGQEVGNFNGRTYRIMEKLSPENFLLMDKDSGNFLVACGMRSYARYPKGTQRF